MDGGIHDTVPLLYTTKLVANVVSNMGSTLKIMKDDITPGTIPQLKNLIYSTCYKVKCLVAIVYQLENEDPQHHRIPLAPILDCSHTTPAKYNVSL